MQYGGAYCSADELLDLAIEYAVSGQYKDGLSKDKKRAVRKKAHTLEIDNGEVFIKKKNNKVRTFISWLFA